METNHENMLIWRISHAIESILYRNFSNNNNYGKKPLQPNKLMHRCYFCSGFYWFHFVAFKLCMLWHSIHFFFINIVRQGDFVLISLLLLIFAFVYLSGSPYLLSFSLYLILSLSLSLSCSVFVDMAVIFSYSSRSPEAISLSMNECFSGPTTSIIKNHRKHKKMQLIFVKSLSWQQQQLVITCFRWIAYRERWHGRGEKEKHWKRDGEEERTECRTYRLKIHIAGQCNILMSAKENANAANRLTKTEKISWLLNAERNANQTWQRWIYNA